MRQSSAVGERRLRIILAALEPPMEGSQLILGVGEVQTIAVTVTSENCEDCRVELDADPSTFEIVSGSPSVSLGSGTFEKTVEWEVRAIMAGQSELQIRGTAGDLRQWLLVRVKIHRLPNLED
jgi:hypothetical protein